MNKMSPIAAASLLERAAAKFDFATALREPANDAPPLDDGPVARAPAPRPEPVAPSAPVGWTDPLKPNAQDPLTLSPSKGAGPELAPVAPAYRGPRRSAEIDRARLAEHGFILPEARPGRLAEEFRVVKRQLLLAAAGRDGGIANGRLILVSSASPDEGKTFCSLNLALSMAREPELDVVLIDGDFSKPEIVATLGLDDGPGLMDALGDHSLDVESCLIETDIPRLSVLPAGERRDDTTELLASTRTRDVLARLLTASPQRVVIFDSPPALSASPASVLALHAGQTVLVVKADSTSEAELREAITMLDGCRNIQLLLNAASFAPGGRRFGSYYGYGDA